MADAARVAVRRVEAMGPGGESLKFGVDRAELGDASVDLGLTRGQQAEHVGARCLAGIAKGDDAADLAEGEPGGLRGPNEPEATGCVGLVGAVTRGSSGR